jgi:hypothetical protein
MKEMDASVGYGLSRSGIEGSRRLAAGLTGALPIDDFASRVLTSAAATRHWQMDLYFIQRCRTPIHYLANLAVTDCMADTHVHGRST